MLVSHSNDGIKLSLVIPVYREEGKIFDLVRNIKEIVRMGDVDSFEAIIVNDGSDDNTLNELLEATRTVSDICVISYGANKGKGYAVRQGILKSRGEKVIFMDGDMEIHPVDIKQYLQALESHDLVIGSKCHPLSQVHAPLSRRLLSFVFNTMVRHFFRMNLKDTQTGLKCGRGDILRAIFNMMTIDRYAFDVEFLAIASSLNLMIKELPVILNYSTSLKLVEIVKMLLDLISIFYRLRVKSSYQTSLNQIKRIPIIDR